MWTIPYEFRCYILVALLGTAAIFSSRTRFAIAPIVLACLAVAGLGDDNSQPGQGLITFAFGATEQDVRLFGMFGAGMVFALFRRRIPLTDVVAAVAAAVLIASLFSSPLCNLAIGSAGAYVIFGSPIVFQLAPLARFTDRSPFPTECLYAWPIILRCVPDASGNQSVGMSGLTLCWPQSRHA